MKRMKDLLAARANTWAQMQAFMATAEAEGRDLTAEESQSYDQMETDLRTKSEEIDRLRRHDEHVRSIEDEERNRDGDTPPTDPDNPTRSEEQTRYHETFGMFLRFGMAELEPEQRRILRTGFRNANELRAQGIATGGAGGFLVPEGFRQKIVERQKFFGSVRSVAEVITTETGNPLPWPTNDDTANKGALLAENTQVTEQDLTIGTDQLDAYMYTSKLVRASLQFLQDATAIDAEDFLERKLAERIERILNEHFTTGTGTAQPEGIQTGATVGKTGLAGQVATYIYDDLVDLIHSVDPAYRNSGGTSLAFMMHDTALANGRKLKDTTNRPLWEPSLQADRPDTLLGYRVVVNNDMPVPAASAKSILFGDFRAGYVIRDVREFALLRLEERYADFLQVGFLGFSRHDGEVQDTNAYKAYAHPAA